MTIDNEGGRLASSTRLQTMDLGPRAHMCAFFSSDEEAYTIALPFIKEGIAKRDKGFHTLDPRKVSDHFRWLESAGIDTERHFESKLLECKTWEDVYWADGVFKPEVTNSIFGGVITNAVEQGYESVRFVADMGWIQPRDIDELLINEARWTEVQPQMPPCHVICMYDLRKFRGDVVLQVMRTHPEVIIDGTIHINPFFVSPGDFIRELEERGRHRIGQ